MEIYNLAITQLIDCMFFAGFAFIYGPENKEFKVIAFKAVEMYWCVTQATGNWLMFSNCHRKQGFTKLYKEMNELSNQSRLT